MWAFSLPVMRSLAVRSLLVHPIHSVATFLFNPLAYVQMPFGIPSTFMNNMAIQTNMLKFRDLDSLLQIFTARLGLAN